MKATEDFFLEILVIIQVWYLRSARLWLISDQWRYILSGLLWRPYRPCIPAWNDQLPEGWTCFPNGLDGLPPLPWFHHPRLWRMQELICTDHIRSRKSANGKGLFPHPLTPSPSERGWLRSFSEGEGGDEESNSVEEKRTQMFSSLVVLMGGLHFLFRNRRYVYE